MLSPLTARRRGIAALELALALPTMVLLLALIFAIASTTLEQTRAAIDARRAAWRLGLPTGAAPLRLGFDPQEELATAQQRRRPQVARPLRILDRDATASVTLLRGTWDTPGVPLDRPTEPFLPHLDALELVVQGAAEIPHFTAPPKLTDFVADRQGEQMAQFTDLNAGGGSFGLPGGGLGGDLFGQIAGGIGPKISIPGMDGGGGGVGGFVGDLVGGAADAITGGSLKIPDYNPKIPSLGDFSGVANVASEGLTDLQNVLMEAGRDLLKPVDEILTQLMKIDGPLMDAALVMVKAVGGGGDLKKSIEDLRNFKKNGWPTSRLIEASWGR